MTTYIVIYYSAINLMALLFMGMDKRKAVKGQWRIPEKTLWLLAWFGGAGGGWLGMKWFRHKTKHGLFKNGMPFLFLVHILFVFWISDKY
ncbi:DUF1294 domain-containing protein [Bacillaceae bacterium S4-13-58]